MYCSRFMSEGKCPHKCQVDFENWIKNTKQDIVHKTCILKTIIICSFHMKNPNERGYFFMAVFSHLNLMFLFKY